MPADSRTNECRLARDLAAESYITGLLRAGSEKASPPWFVRVYEEVSSTMDCVRDENEQAKFLTPGLILAKRQHHGRGRAGRNWECAEGALYATYLFRSELPVRAFQGFSLVVGCAAAYVLEQCGARVRLKWPNDILDGGGRKCGGVLIEVHCDGSGSLLAVGLGMNVTAIPAALPDATSVELMLGRRIDIEELAARIAHTLHEYWNTFQAHGFKAFRQAWMSSACFIGEAVRVECGAKTSEGIFVGVGDCGEALIQVGARTETVVSGDLLRLRS